MLEELSIQEHSSEYSEGTEAELLLSTEILEEKTLRNKHPKYELICGISRVSSLSNLIEKYDRDNPHEKGF